MAAGPVSGTVGLVLLWERKIGTDVCVLGHPLPHPASTPVLVFFGNTKRIFVLFHLSFHQ